MPAHTHRYNSSQDQAVMAAIDYLIERGGSIFPEEIPEKTVYGVGRIIPGYEIYRILCDKGVARINTRKNFGDALFGDTIEMVKATPNSNLLTGR